MKVMSFGEAMIRFAPTEDQVTPLRPSGKRDFVFTIAGDELNVCIALSRLDIATEWVSVLPSNSHGQVIMQSSKEANVETGRVIIDDSPAAEVGTFFVVPEKKTVEYQRRNSAFAKQLSKSFDWEAIYKGVNWMHCTGITPAIAAGPLSMWQESLDAAVAASVPISLDLNHRPQLGTLPELWNIVLPYLSSIQVIVLSIGQIIGLAKIEGYTAPLPSGDLTVASSERWIPVLQYLYDKWKGPAVICCFKIKGESSNWGGVQRRWSVLVNSAGVHTTTATPVWHSPKDELGGGSAWSAGLIHHILHSGSNMLTVADASAALRAADLLAALCQVWHDLA
jgi:sugar/nucleoside kinase (ribokinase family)